MVIRNLQQMWDMINESRLRDPLDVSTRRPLVQIVKRYYMRFGWSLALAMAMSSTHGLFVYVYAYASKVIADDIVQVQLMAQATDPPALRQENPHRSTLAGLPTSDPIDPRPTAPRGDPTYPGQRQLFGAASSPRTQAVDTQADQRPGKPVSEKLRLLGLLALVLIFAEILRHGMHFFGAERKVAIAQNVSFRLRQQLHKKLLALPPAYHDQHRPGKLLTHLFTDVHIIQNQATMIMRMLPIHLVSMAFGIGLVLWVDWRLAMIVFIALPSYAIVYRWFSKRLRTVSENLREREGGLNAHIAGRVASFLLVKAFVREAREGLDFVRQTKPIMRNSVAMAVLNTGFAVTCLIITGACMGAVLWIGALKVRTGEMTLGTLLLFYASAGHLFAPVAAMTHMAAMYHRLRSVADRVIRVLDEPIDLADPEVAKVMPPGASAIRFDQVSMRYRRDAPEAVRDLSFELPGGKRLCIMGPSGSGKSTVAKLAARFYDPDQGSVSFDGIDLRQFRIIDLRKHVGFVAQDPVIFSGTIADNIRYGMEDAHPEQVMTAAKFAQIHDFINQMPRRYRTLTQERGLTLSGGQKQRINLARTLLYSPSVLVLDDCTSALDAQTEADLIQAFDTALRDKTAIIVSHRVSIAMECDYVMTMDRGRAVQFGPPAQLLRETGPFADLYHQQEEKASRAEADLSLAQA